MTTGRPPVPVERKRRNGNPGHRPLPELVSTLPMARETPEPLRPLGQVGRDTWDRLWNHAITWLSPNSDIEYVQMVCETADERAALRVKVLREGDTDDRKALRALDEQHRKGLSQLGMTPTDRTRLGLAEVTRVSKLSKLRDGS